MASQGAMDGLTPDQEQERLLEAAKKTVLRESLYMKRAFDNDDFPKGIQHAVSMCSELRTGHLTPRNYYDLYMYVADQLRVMESYVDDAGRKHPKTLAELYEVVQYSGAVIPRLYLQVTVGSAYIRSKQVAAKDILQDLVEMCRGVQHPMRGLFLRNYLSQACKDKLPDVGSEYEGRGGNVKNAVEFVLQNFVEMNKVWVRLQRHGPARNREKRETERLELRILVGTNLVRLSQLEGVDSAYYAEHVLPRILEEIIGCRDQIAQQYLMESLIQVFPDEFHLATLEPLLIACGEVHKAVDIRAIVVSLADRLAAFVKRDDNGVPENINVFKVFSDYLPGVIRQRQALEGAPLSLADLLSVYVSFLALTLACYPRELSYVDQILLQCTELVKGDTTNDRSTSAIKQMMALLTTPVDYYRDIQTVLSLQHYPGLMSFLPVRTRKNVARNVITSVLSAQVPINNPEKVEQLLEFVAPLYKPDASSPKLEEMDPLDLEEVEEELNLVARLMHLMNHEDLDVLYDIFDIARNQFAQGGERRMRHTNPPLIFALIQLAIRLKRREDDGSESGKRTSDECWRQIHQLTSGIGQGYPMLGLRLFMQAAFAAAVAKNVQIAYEYVTQAFVLYEESVTDSRQQAQALQFVIGTVQQLSFAFGDDYETLVTKCAQYASKLLKKPDQCRAVYMSAHLFWAGEGEGAFHREKRVLECLQKSLKIADACMDAVVHVQLFVEILNQYLFFFGKNNTAVTHTYLNTLLVLINSKMDSMQASTDGAVVKTYYKDTLAYVEKMKATDERYADIVTAPAAQ